MAISNVTQLPLMPPAPVVDFGWYFGEVAERLQELTYSVGTDNYPPGRTTLTANITLPVTTISVASTSSFSIGPGTLKLDNGSSHPLVQYTGMTATTFTGCSGGTGTFNSGVQVYDPRFYVDQLPLNLPVTFDAVDTQGLGLPVVQATVPIINYQWNFGNGLTGFGSASSTQYRYGAAPPLVQCTLTVTDALGRQYSAAKCLNIAESLPVYSEVGHFRS